MAEYFEKKQLSASSLLSQLFKIILTLEMQEKK